MKDKELASYATIKKLKSILTRLRIKNNKKFHAYTWQQMKVLKEQIAKLEGEN